MQPDAIKKRSYRAFISYSHALDGDLAPAIQRALETFAKPWYRSRILNIYRDETSLSATPELWPEIQRALDDSEYLILMASPESVNSRWVRREVSHWLKHKDSQRILVVLTSGEIHWDAFQNDFDWSATNAIPPELTNVFSAEPLYVDFTDLRSGKDELVLRNPRFLDRIHTLAATLHGVSKDQIASTYARQQRLLRFFIGGAISLILAGAVGSAILARYYRQARNTAERRAQEIQFELDARLAGSRIQTEAQQSALPLALAAAGEQLEAFGEVSTSVYSALRHGLDASRELYQWEAPNAQDIAFDPETSGILTISVGREIRLWSKSGDLVSELLKEDWERIGETRLTPSRSAFVTRYSDSGEMRIWNLSGREIRTQQQSVEYAISAIDISADHSTMAIGDSSGTISIFNLKNKARPLRIAVYPSPIRLVALSQDGRTALTNHQGGSVIFVDLETRRVSPVPALDLDLTKSPFVLTSDGLQLFFAEDNKFWNFNRAQERLRSTSLKVARGNFRSISITADDRMIALTPEYDPRTFVLNAQGDLEFEPLQGCTDCVSAIHPSGKWLVTSGYYDGLMRVYDLQPALSQDLNGLLGENATWTPSSLSICEDPTLVLPGGQGGRIHVVDSETRLLKAEWKAHDDQVEDIACLGDNSLVSVGDGRLVHWRGWSTQEGVTLDTGEATVERIAAVSNNNPQLIGISMDKVLIWEPLRQTAPTNVIDAPKVDSWWRVALAPDSETIIIGGQDGHIAALDVTRGGHELFQPVKALRGPVWALAPAPTSDFFVCAGSVTDVREMMLFDFTGRLRSELLDPGFSFVYDAAVGPKGRFVIASTWNGQISLFGLKGERIGPVIRGVSENLVVLLEIRKSDSILVSAGNVSGKPRLALTELDPTRLIKLGCDRLRQHRTVFPTEEYMAVKARMDRICTKASNGEL